MKFLILNFALLLASTSTLLAQDTLSQVRTLSIQETVADKQWQIFDGEELFAGYISDSNGRPSIYPIHSPSGLAMTRQYPIEEALPSETKDHPHHRSMWFGQDEVNGYDFWADEGENGDIDQTGIQFGKTDDGKVFILTTNDWNAPDGKRVLSDVRNIIFSKDNERRMIDFAIKLIASDGPVHFGDTKEGSFALRVAGTMKVDAKKGGVIINAENIRNADAWGKRSAWVDYSGPVDEQTVGFTIHDHTRNLNYPCRWHVRNYGLFGANPFGQSHFTGGEPTKGFTSDAGQELNLMYRVVLHQGNLDREKTMADNNAFGQTSLPALELNQ